MESESTPKTENNFPEGFANWSLDRKEEFMNRNQSGPSQEGMQDQEESKFEVEQVDKGLLDKLNDAGIKVEIAEALMNLAMYNDEEKVLQIRQDATTEHVNNFIKENVLKEQERGDEIPVQASPEDPDYIHIEDDEEDENDQEGGGISNWAQLSNTFKDFDFEFNEEHLKKFEEVNSAEAVESKYGEIVEAVESFPKNDRLKEKFSTVRLGYPKYEGESKIFIENNILYLDLGINKQEITDFLNSLTFAEGKKEEEITVQEPSPVTKEVEKETAEPKVAEIRTSNGSVYKYMPDGRTQRFKTVTGEQLEPQDTITFIPPWDIVREEATKIYPQIFDHIENQAQYEQLLLKYAQTEGHTIRVVDENGKEITSSQGVNQENNVFLSFVDKNDTGQNFNLPVSGKPQIGYMTYDTRKYVGEDGKTYREKHIGNSVTEIITEQNPTSAPVPQEENEPQSENAELEQKNPEQETRPAGITPEEAKVLEENYVPEWKKSDEYKKFEMMRDDLSRYEVPTAQLGMSSVGLELKRSEYRNYKEAVAKKIEESFRKNAGENLTPEQEEELKSVTNDAIFRELIKTENDSYKKALQEHRSETLKDKAKEALKSAVATKVVQGYLKLSKKQRMAVNILLGSGIGLAAGAAVAPGFVGALSYMGWRAARVGLSGVAGWKAGEWANKKWSIEELESAKQKELEDLKNSELPLEEKTQGFEDIEKRFDKEKAILMAKRVGTTMAAGASAGFATGLAEHAVIGPSVTEAHAGKSASLHENKLGPRKGFEPAGLKPAEHVIPEQTPKVVVQPTEKLFADPNVLIHKVESGDSTWKILEKTLDNNEQFKGMTEAQKTYVLSALTNKVLQNPEQYGLGKGGVLSVEDKTDFTKLFEDTKEIKSVFSKAEQTIAPGSHQEESILANNKKIANWVNKNPDESLTNDKVSEILADKPKMEVDTEPIEPMKVEVAENAPVVEPIHSPISDTLEKPKIGPEQKAINEILPHEKNNFNEGQIHEEIEKAKERLAHLEGNTRNPNLERTLVSDTKINQEVETAFRNEIDGVYGKKGVFGLGKINGLNSKEWGEMAKLPASKVVEYYTGDSTKSGLASEVVEKLSKSKSHNALMKQVAGLMEQSGGTVKPYENENVDQFVKRLGGYVLKTHLQKAV